MDSASAAGQPKRILVVDDDAVNRELLSTLLTSKGYSVEGAPDGGAALRRVAEAPPDLVLLDVMMPQMSGFEVCAKMKQLFGARYVPVILLTALEDVESLEKGFDAGADDFVSKPFEPRVLLARVRSSLRAKGLWDQLAKTQERLIEAERMAAIGHMTVTLKHEINNPLQTIIGYADYLLSILPPHHEFHDQIEAICKGGERISELLGKLDRVRQVKTTTYLGEGRMVDLDQSSRPPDAPEA